MNINIAELWKKYRKIITYLICSVIAALFEASIGWILLNALVFDIVITNIMAIFAGAVIHYFLTIIFVFKIKNSPASVLVYVITFGLGILLQSLVIKFFYVILAGLPGVYRYIISKGLSLVIPFAVIYFVRNILNEKIKGKETSSDE